MDFVCGVGHMGTWGMYRDDGKHGASTGASCGTGCIIITVHDTHRSLAVKPVGAVKPVVKVKPKVKARENAVAPDSKRLKTQEGFEDGNGRSTEVTGVEHEEPAGLPGLLGMLATCTGMKLVDVFIIVGQFCDCIPFCTVHAQGTMDHLMRMTRPTTLGPNFATFHVYTIINNLCASSDILLQDPRIRG